MILEESHADPLYPHDDNLCERRCRMKFYDQVLADAALWKPADWYDALSEMDRHDTDMAIGWGRADNWGYLKQAQTLSRIRKTMPQAVVIDASNVADYCVSHGFDPHAVPSYMPPFDIMWMESSKPFALYDHDTPYQQVGALLVAHHSDGGPYADPYTTVVCSVFVRHQGKIQIHPEQDSFIEEAVYLDASGQWHQHSESSHGFWHEAVQTEAVRSMAPFFMAIGFMHCKNVEMIQGSQPEAPLRKKQERKLGRPLTDFRELVIDPNVAQRRSAGDSRRMSPGTRSLHIARGHFAHYSEDKPLFGKYTGTFWRPAHVRGSADAGTVYKDYKVKP